MEATRFRGLLEDLDDGIDDLEDKVQRLLEKGLGDQASQLPLLDKAKLSVLTPYAVESALFFYLRLNDVDARSHPIFRELRVKQYFEKIKAVGSRDNKQETLRLDKAAAGRLVKPPSAANQIAAGQKRAATSDSDVPLKRPPCESKNDAETPGAQGETELKTTSGPVRRKAKQHGKKGNKGAKRQRQQAQEQKRNPITAKRNSQ